MNEASGGQQPPFIITVHTRQVVPPISPHTVLASFQEIMLKLLGYT